MDKAPKQAGKHLLIKRIAYIFIGIILLITSAAFYISWKWKPFLTKTIQNVVIDASDSLYRIKFADIQVNIITGSAYLDSIELIPDTLIYKKLISQRKAPENLFELKIKNLGLENVRPLKVYFQKKLAIDAIIIEKPELTVIYTRLKNQRRKKEDNRSTYQRIKKVLKSAKATSIFLSNVKFKYIDKSLKTPQITKLDRLNIRLNDILIDSVSQFDTTRIFNTKDIIAEINDFTYPTADSLYYLNIGKLRFSTLERNLMLTKVGLLPRYGEMAFANLFDKQKERYKITFDSLIASEINYPIIIEQRKVTAQKLLLKGGDVSAFVHRGKAPKGIDKGKNFPHIALRKVNWDINLDTILINQTHISYSEYNPKSESKGTIFFQNLNGSIYNVTNDSVKLSINKFANANLRTSLLGKGNLKIQLKFNLVDDKGAFSFNGTLGPMELSAINAATKSLALVKTNSGKINSMEFSIRGNVDEASGTLKMNYEDLKVILLKKEEEENFKRMGLVSLIANALLLKSDNPSDDEPIRVAKPYYKRPPDGSFFNLMWKVMFEGLKESVGITKEKESKMKERAENFKDAKEKREARKLERKKKREARRND